MLTFVLGVICGGLAAAMVGMLAMSVPTKPKAKPLQVQVLRPKVVPIRRPGTPT